MRPPKSDENDATDSNTGTLTRRVSFSNRVTYSDEASTTTVTTDDELYRDDGSFQSDSNDDDVSLVGGESMESDTEAADDASDEEMDDDVEEENVLTQEDNGEEKESKMDDDDENEEESNNKDMSIDRSEPWSPLDDQTPLIIRDMGVSHRPTEYLGGYEDEMSSSSNSHRVKLRRSWLVESKDDVEDVGAPYDQYEAWKKSRVAKTPSFRKKQHDEDHQSKTNGGKDRSLAESTKKEKAVAKDGPTAQTDGSGEKATQHDLDLDEAVDSTENVVVDENPKGKVKQTNAGVVGAVVGAGDAAKFQAKPKSALKKKGEETAKETSKSSGGIKLSPVLTQKPKRKDPETEADEKEIMELKAHVTKLQRKLDVIDVRTISQLADLEEETTKRMREYRGKADNVVRKKRAKEEKQSLKEKSMHSQDLIEQLRRSNQKLRAGGIKMKETVEELKKSNQLLTEKKSFHGDYAAQFRSFQEVEVRLAEELNKTLSRDMPKYEKLARGMDEGCKDRARSGHCERNAKDLYLDCMQSIFTMLEEDSTDDNLIDRVASMMDEESDVDQEMEESMKEDELIAPKSAKPSRRSKAASSSDINKTTTKDSPKRTSKRHSSKSDALVASENLSPTKSPVRRSLSSNTGGKRAAGPGRIMKTANPRPSSRRPSSSSFRGTRSSQKTTSTKVVSDDDDDAASSTCSITSVQSDNYSLAPSLAEYA